MKNDPEVNRFSKLGAPWSPPPARPHLENQDIHVWLVELDRPPAGRERYEQLLSAEEKSRAARFKFDRDRRRYGVAHGALRSILAAYLTVPPQELEFLYGDRGKPKLAPIPGKALGFNLSHSHEVAVVAVVRQGEVGVDVEYVKEDFPFLEVSKRFFSSKEVAALNSLPNDLQRVAFFKCWTSKEAYLKAKGTGLFGELDEVDLILTAESAVNVKGAVAGWALREVTITENYAAAVVAEGKQHELRYYQWEGGA